MPEWYEAPTFYFTNPYALDRRRTTTSPSRPARSAFDFELEVAVVVGRDGASLTPEQAREHVFGYTILNDWSARDLQAPRDEGQPRARPRARTPPPRSGPWLVTADELEPYRDADGFLALDMRVSVNGDRDRPGPAVQHGLAVRGADRLRLPRHLGRAPATCSARAPAATAAASPSCGARRGEPDPPPLQPGDVVEMTVEGIGTIRNRVVPGARPAAGPPGAPAAADPEAARRDGRVAGKVVVVTGAGQGQGAAEARLLAAEGATVIGCDLTPEPAEELPGVEYRQLDVTDAAAWAALAAELRTARRSTGWSPTPASPGGPGWPTSTRPTWPGCTRSTSPARCSASRRSRR